MESYKSIILYYYLKFKQKIKKIFILYNLINRFITVFLTKYNFNIFIYVSNIASILLCKLFDGFF